MFIILEYLQLSFFFSDPSRVLNLLAAPKCGTTPLHDAAENNHLKVVELLVSTGGNLPVFLLQGAISFRSRKISELEQRRRQSYRRKTKI